MKNTFQFLILLFLSLSLSLQPCSSAFAQSEEQAEAKEVDEAFEALDEDQLPLMHLPTLSPDGKQVAFQQGIKGEMVLRVINLETGAQYAMRKHDEMEFFWHSWVNNERLIFALKMANEDLSKKEQYFNDVYDEEFDVKGSYTGPTRLFSVNNELKDAINIFKLGLTSRRYKESPRDAATRVKQQATVIDLLFDDPNHILTTVDEDLDLKGKVRKVNVYDGSFEVVQNERDGITSWVTDQNGDVRYGHGMIGRSLKTLKKSLIYLNPETNQWERSEGKSWDKEDYTVVAFADDPRFAYIREPDGAFVLHDMVKDEPVANVEYAQYLNALLTPARGIIDNKIIGYWDRTGTYYFDPYFAMVQNTINEVLQTGFSIIVSASREQERYIIFNKTSRTVGAYYLLDLKAGTFSKIMDIL